MLSMQRLVVLGLAGCLFLDSGAFALAQAPAPAPAQQQPGTAPAQPPAPTPEEHSTITKIEKTLADYLQRGMNLFSSTVETAVPYRAPEVLPNGDIIIRRVPSDEKSNAAAPAATGTQPAPASSSAPSAPPAAQTPSTPVAPPSGTPADKGTSGKKN